MRLTPTRNTFTGGEWAPSLWGRWDHEKYDTACVTMRNFFVHPHGSASNRGGTYFIGEVRDSNEAVREIPFQFSVVQTYSLILNDGYMQVVKGYAFVESGGNRVEFAIPWASADLADLQYAQIADTLYVVHPSYQMRKITRTSDTAWTISTVTIGSAQSDPTNPQRIVGSGTTHKFVVTATSATGEESIASAEVQAGTGDTVSWTAPTGVAYHSIYKDANGATGVYGWVADVALKSGEGVAKSISNVTQANPGVVTTSAAHGLAAGDFIVIYSVVGMTELNNNYYRVGESPGATDFHLHDAATNANLDTTGYTAYISGGSVRKCGTWVVQDITADQQETPPEVNDPFSGADNYPGSIAFFQGRCVYGRTNNKPDTVWASQTWHYDNFNKSHVLRDDDSWEFTLASGTLNALTWMLSLDKLLVGTGASEWRLDGGSASDAITPTSINCRAQSHRGSAWRMPVIVGDTVLFLLFGQNSIRELSYALAVDAYTGDDVTILARHLFDRYTISQWAYQRQPNSIVWGVRDDGVLLGLTYLKEQKVICWHRHDTDGDFEDVISLPSGTGTDDVYFCVRRVINGTVKRYIEILETRLPTDDIKDAFFVDCGKSLDSPMTISGITQANPCVVTTVEHHGFIDGDLVDISDVEGMTEVNGYRFAVDATGDHTFHLHDATTGVDINSTAFSAYISGGYVRKAVTSITGLGHLEGEAVAVLADGNVIPGKTVSGGAITLTTPASRVHVGLGYTCDLEPLDFVLGDAAATTQDKLRRIGSAVVHVQDTRAMKIGPDEDNLSEALFRSADVPGAWPTPLFTGFKYCDLFGGENDKSRVFIRVDEPLPLTVLAIIPRLSIGGAKS